MPNDSVTTTAQTREVPLAQQQWTPIPYDAVCLALLRAEYQAGRYARLSAAHCALIENADTTNQHENATRQEILADYRGRLGIPGTGLMGEVPHNTSWFNVRFFRAGHLGRLHALDRHEWRSPDDRNELFKIAKRMPEALREPPAAWTSILLLAVARAGPFTILEGNHRLIALAGQGRIEPFAISVIVGLSTAYCAWHRWWT